MTFWVAGAAIVGSIGSAVIGSKSASKAVDAQTESANKAEILTREQIAMQQKQFDQARADAEPWRLAGGSAVNRLAAQPDFAFDASHVGTDPGYQFGLSEGMKGLTNSAAARGNLLSGAALKASTKYAQDYAGTKVSDAFTRQLQTRTSNDNRLQSLGGIGMSSVGSTNAVGSQLSNQFGQAGQSMAQNALGVGNARASGYLAQGNALTGALNQGVSAWNQYNNSVKPPAAGEIGSSGWYANNDYLTS